MYPCKVVLLTGLPADEIMRIFLITPTKCEKLRNLWRNFFYKPLTFLADRPINPRIRMNPPSAERGTECPNISRTWPRYIYSYLCQCLICVWKFVIEKKYLYRD